MIKGAVADHIGRFMDDVCAVIIGMLAIGAGLRWLQAVKSPNPSLQSGTAETARGTAAGAGARSSARLSERMGTFTPRR